MKRKLAAGTLGVMMAAMLAVTGCGGTTATGTDGGSAKNEDTTTDAEVEDSEVTAYYESDETELDSAPEEASCFSKQFLWLLQDDNAEYQETLTYDNGMTATYSYEGTYTQDGNVIVFTANGGEVQTITTDGNEKILSTEYSFGDADIEEIVGTYTGETEEYGTVTLEIAGDATAQMTTADGTVMNGTIYGGDGAWEFLSDIDEGYGIDWVLGFDGDTFTYQSYGNYYYGDYAGDYECVGDLGTLTITVDSEGKASTEVTFAGETRQLTGCLNVEPEDGSILGFDLYDETGYGLYITITQLEDGTMNYSGYYTVPLAAG